MGKKMNNPYELAKNILQSVSDESQPIPANEGFRSIDLYGSSVHGKNENEDTFNRFHLENESGVGILRYIRCSRESNWSIMTCIWSIATRIRNRRPM